MTKKSRHVFHPSYAPEWPGHVFPTEKYRLVAARVGGPFLEPEPATDAELELVHPRTYLERLTRMTERPELGYAEFEVPVSRTVLDAFRIQTGGSILAARTALERGAAANLGGGFHHAFADRGEGFCLLNDLAVLIRVMRRDGLIRTAAVVDLDLHQGNGTARIFRDDPDVFTFSMHQERLYPAKERSSLDIGLDNGTGDAEYLRLLRGALPKALGGPPDLVVYQAGADPFEEDQLGDLKLTKAGLAERDAIVFREVSRIDRPVVVTLGGGYPPRTEDVVDIHAATLRLMNEICG